MNGSRETMLYDIVHYDNGGVTGVMDGGRDEHWPVPLGLNLFLQSV